MSGTMLKFGAETSGKLYMGVIRKYPLKQSWKSLQIAGRHGLRARRTKLIVAPVIGPRTINQWNCRDWDIYLVQRKELKKWAVAAAKTAMTGVFWAFLAAMAELLRELEEKLEEHENGLDALQKKRETLEKFINDREGEEDDKRVALAQIKKEYDNCYVDWGSAKTTAMAELNRELAVLKNILKDLKKDLDKVNSQSDELGRILDEMADDRYHEWVIAIHN